MCQVTLSESHKETDSLDAWNVECQRLNLLVVQQIHIFHAYLRKIIFPLDLHRFRLHPVAVFPVRALSGHFPDIDLRIEVRRKRIAVISAVTVQNINIMNFIKIMFQGVSRKYAGHTRIKSTSKKGCDPCFFVFFSICPLPFVLKFCGIFRLVICCINIMYASLQTGVHNRQILIR